VQSEFYLGAPGGEVDVAKVQAEHPDTVVCNGYVASTTPDRDVSVVPLAIIKDFLQHVRRLGPAALDRLSCGRRPRVQ
jgi:hypothetical protein